MAATAYPPSGAHSQPYTPDRHDCPYRAFKFNLRQLKRAMNLDKAGDGRPHIPLVNLAPDDYTFRCIVWAAHGGMAGQFPGPTR